MTMLSEAATSEVGAVMAEIQKHIFENGAQLADTLANYVSDAINSGIAERGRASLVLSGGGTPARLFQQLASRPIPWTDVSVTLSDERWVDETSDDSNAAMLRRELLTGDAAAAEFISLKTPDETPEDGEVECARRLAGMTVPYDLVLLGMGADGHTASLFPGDANLERALDPDSQRACIAAHPPGAAQARMSLTLANLLNCRQLVLLISGETKRDVLETALEEGPVEAMPVRALLRQTSVPVDVFWAP
ncbi:6-phosphogluconolactonase [Pelagibius sp. Alg239-R121]|uniref:6-phosphogluconolactonase n=1 Tax=Pelagibius sp. Alg239-R121 TaxID=2993448 RepID=UPI0024A6D90A|nr:6-phosphogluconolactonase [Pelagibius sp. Alg239-R121]